MLNNKKISVIIPVYNTEDFIEKCLYSVCNQTYKNLEIIIVNDGTKDNSEEIINKYLNSDSRIIYLKKKNGGLSSARNYGLKYATGDFLSFVDSDDFIELDMYESMIKYSENADIVITGHFIYDGRCEKINGIRGYAPLYFNREEALVELCKNDFIESHVWDKLYKRDLFKNIIFPVGKNYEDIYIMHEVFERSNIIVHTNNPKYYYLKRFGSISHVDSLKNVLDLFDSFLKRYKFLQKYDNKEMKLIQESVIADYYLYYGLYYRKQLKKVWEFIKELNDGFEKYLSRKRRIQLKLLKYRISLKAQYRIYRFLKKKKKIINFLLTRKEIIKYEKTNENQIFFIGYPEYNNLGDHAIAYASIKYLNDNFPYNRINIITENKFAYNIKRYKKIIKRNDLIFVQGGGNVGDEYKDQELMRKKIIKEFPDNLIINFPVTIYFKNTDNYDRIMNKYYNKKYYFLCREKYTYEYIKKDKNIKSYLTPDIVLYLKGKLNLSDERKSNENKIVCCLRNDIESKLSFNDRLKIKDILFKRGLNVNTVDTCTNYDISFSNSKEELDKYLANILDAKLVITDRLHGLIFAYLVGVPCVVFSNYNHKIIGIYEWLKKTGSVYLANDLNDLNYILNQNFTTDCNDINFNNSFDIIHKILEKEKWK